ncbi:MAG: type II toxin-antitoxin system RelE/ParE family toxin [Magnetococcales bacterium]|nr:type II toxin-antitoxin system RelE/ParE family toxin [Magnetococcales bacterium]
MIKSFRCKETEKIFNGQVTKRYQGNILKRARMRLDRIDAAAVLDDLRVPPSHHLEALRGDRLGRYSIRINDQWRVCFIWTENGVHDVEIVDYH